MKGGTPAEEIATDTLMPVALGDNGQGWASQGAPLVTPPKKELSHQLQPRLKLCSILSCTFFGKTMVQIFGDKL